MKAPCGVRLPVPPDWDTAKVATLMTLPITVTTCGASGPAKPAVPLSVAVKVTVSVNVPACVADSDTVGLAEAPAVRPLNAARPVLIKAEVAPLSVKLPESRSAGAVAALTTARVVADAAVAPCRTVPRFRT